MARQGCPDKGGVGDRCFLGFPKPLVGPPAAVARKRSCEPSLNRVAGDSRWERAVTLGTCR